MSTTKPIGWVLVGWAENDVVATITEGYVREDRADLDCEMFNGMGDGLRYTVEPVMHPTMAERYFSSVAPRGSWPYAMPETTVRAIRAYAVRRTPPGDFVTAVLENNLREAVGRADPLNRAALDEIVRYCTWEIPSACWGSPQKVDEWLGDKS